MALMNKPVSKISSFILQLHCFGLVGILAATTHYVSVICLVELGGLTPLLSNFFAFLISFQVSYWGHRSLTFRGTTTPKREGMLRFFLVAITGFTVNQSLFYFFLNHFDWSYRISLLIVIAIVASMTFIFSKIWVFRF
ncbi:MAG: GtrA family protein [Proteobacteria bacterium]|nr:GtrA family protein [Pseudomonadota bacterium]